MRKILLSILVLVLHIYKGESQYMYMKDKEEGKVLDTLRQKLTGVKYVRLFTNEEVIQSYKSIIGNAASSKDLEVVNGFADYVNEDLNKGFVLTEEQQSQANRLSTSLCDFVTVAYDIGTFKRDLGAIGSYPLTVYFVFCDGSQYSYKRIVGVSGTTDYRRVFRNAFSSIINLKNTRKIKYEYLESNRLSLKTNPIVISYNSFNNYLDTCKNLQKCEGIYELFSTENQTVSYKLGIYNDNGTLKLICIDAGEFKLDWKEGELKGILTKTKSDYDFLMIYYSGSKIESKGTISFTNENSFNLKTKDLKGTDRYIRIK